MEWLFQSKGSCTDMDGKKFPDDLYDSSAGHLRNF